MDAEDGGLSGGSLVWAVDGNSAGGGEDVAAAGLAPGTHTAVLTATDSTNGVATETVTFAVVALGVPAGNAPQLDGFCDDSAYAAGVMLSLAPYPGGEQAHVTLLRTATHLWACFSGLQKGNSAGANAGLRVDMNNSRDALAQSDDYGFFVGENGDVISAAGDGSGGFGNAGPDGLQAQVSSNDLGWSAELRVESSALGGLEHLIGLGLGHYALDGQNNAYTWPYAALPTPRPPGR
jgi:hypothetical protein